MTEEFKLAVDGYHASIETIFAATQKAFPVGCVVAWLKGGDHHMATVVTHIRPCILKCRYERSPYTKRCGKAWVDARKVTEIVNLVS